MERSSTHEEASEIKALIGKVGRCSNCKKRHQFKEADISKVRVGIPMHGREWFYINCSRAASGCVGEVFLGTVR